MPNRTYHPRGLKIDGYMIRKHPLYNTWALMLSRCYNEKTLEFKNYGGRGISVCERWVAVANFILDMGPKTSPLHTLDRINNDGNYCLENCKWSTRSDQCVNRRKFKNNTVGETGLHFNGTRYAARFDYEGTRYEIGYYPAVIEAAAARSAFMSLFFQDRDAALLSISAETVRLTSSTKARGVTVHGENFVARCTINGVRHYVGFYKTIEGAVNARREFIEATTGECPIRIVK